MLVWAPIPVVYILPRAPWYGEFPVPWQLVNVNFCETKNTDLGH